MFYNRQPQSSLVVPSTHERISLSPTKTPTVVVPRDLPRWFKQQTDTATDTVPVCFTCRGGVRTKVDIGQMGNMLLLSGVRIEVARALLDLHISDHARKQVIATGTVKILGQPTLETKILAKHQHILPK